MVEAFLDVGEFGVEEFVDVAAGGGALVAKVDDAGDFGEGESGGLGVADELEAGAVGFVVGAVSVRGSGWCGQ